MRRLARLEGPASTDAGPAVTSGSRGLDSRRAWAVASAGSMVNAWTFGVFYSFGAAFKQMATEFDAGLGATAAVFAITTFLFFSGGLVAGPLSDRVGPRPLLAFGACSMGLGLFLTSYVQSLTLGYLTYGVGVGLGIAGYLVPMTACVGGWFVQRRALALGLYTGGIGLGTLLLVPAIEWLIRTEGWRLAFRLLGVATAVIYALATLIVARPPQVAASGKAVRSVRSVMRRASFLRMYVAGLLMSTALFVPFVFIIKYSTERGVSDRSAAALISVIGVGSVLGRFGLGALGTKISTARLALFCYLVQPFGYALWLVSDGAYPLLVIFATILGFAYGGYVALSPVLAAELYGVEGLGAILGVLYTSAGLGGLIGPIAAGVLLDATGSFAIVIGVSIGLTAAASLVFLPLGRTQVPSLAK